jgi:hypothetical protein
MRRSYTTKVGTGVSTRLAALLLVLVAVAMWSSSANAQPQADAGSPTLAPPFTLGEVFPLSDVPARPVSDEERTKQIAVQYAKDAGISEDEAIRRLKVQQESNGLTFDAKELLGDDYAGVWIDARTGDVHVGFTKDSERGEVDALLAEHFADTSDASATLVQSSRADLEAAQAQITAGLEKRGPIAWTAIDDTNNRIVVGLGSDATADDRAWVDSIAQDFAKGRRAEAVPSFPPTIKPSPADEADPDRVRTVDVVVKNLPGSATDEARACVHPHCGSPLAGGAGLTTGAYIDTSHPTWYPGASFCSSGFYGRWWNAAQGRFEMYNMTAGHCFYNTPGDWWAWMQPEGRWRKIGPTHTWRFGDYGTIPSGVRRDIGLMRVQEAPEVSYWYTTANARIVMWGWPSSGWDYWPISGQDIAYAGRFGCRTGITTNYTCGSVQYQSRSYNFLVPGGGGATTPVDNEFNVPTACSNPGDSGGPFVDGGTALGMVSGGIGCDTDFSQVNDVASFLGVWVATTPPHM